MNYYDLKQFVVVTVILLFLMGHASTASSNASLFATSPPKTLFTQSVAINFNTSDTIMQCWYPVSGNYGRLPRILFYCMIIFGLLASRNEWLIAGALAAALMYSGSAAIHTCLLIWRGPSYGELDFYAMIPILSTSCTVIVPLLNWSDTLRHLGSREGRGSGARTLILYWGFLLTVGLMTTISQLKGFCLNESHVNPITCATPGLQIDKMDCVDNSCRHTQIYAEWVQANGCLDPCKVQAAHPIAIFRSQSDLQLMSRKEILNVGKVWAGPFISAYFNIGAGLGVFVLLQGVWAACFGRRSPRQCRNTVYSFLKDLRLPSPTRCFQRKGDLRESGRWRNRVAFTVAIAAYLWAVAASTLCVLLFIVNIVAMEYLLTTFPQSESAIHVGAWSPWVTTALLIFAAFVAKYHHSMVLLISTFLKRAIHHIRHLNPQGGRYGKRDRKYKAGRVRSNKKESGTIGPARLMRAILVLLANFRTLIRQRILELHKFVEGGLTGVMSATRQEWISLKEFWQDLDDGEHATQV